ncbi:hypothetical protein D3C83_103160 [compost metagenome]
MAMSLVASKRSVRLTMLTSDVSLNRPMKVLTIGGITIVIACGSTILPIFCQ